MLHALMGENGVHLGISANFSKGVWAHSQEFIEFRRSQNLYLTCIEEMLVDGLCWVVVVVGETVFAPEIEIEKIVSGKD